MTPGNTQCCYRRRSDEGNHRIEASEAINGDARKQADSKAPTLPTHPYIILFSGVLYYIICIQELSICPVRMWRKSLSPLLTIREFVGITAAKKIHFAVLRRREPVVVSRGGQVALHHADLGVEPRTQLRGIDRAK